MRGFEQGVIQSLGEVENGVARLDQRLVRPVTPGMYAADFLMLPGLVGFWPMSSVQRSTGNVYDLSGQGRTLTYNGNPTFNQYTSGGLALPYLDLDGIGDFLSRADETDLDILGTETIYASAVRGLTYGGWFWSDDATGVRQIIGKGPNTGVANDSFMTFYRGDLAGDPFQFTISDGVAYDTVTSTLTTVISAWYFVVTRYTPSSENAIFVNKTKDVVTTSIPAALNNSTATFAIGGSGAGTFLLDGRTSFCFLCANALPDAWIDWLWTRGRVLFNA